MRTVVGVSLAVLLFSSAPAHAQVQRTYWGVSGSIAPFWEVPSEFKELFDADSLRVEGFDFRIGFVRASILGGDWGVSLVHRKISDDSEVSRLSAECPGCGTFYTSPESSMTGVEIHRFVPFGTIKERVQIGMNFAGGVAALTGTVEELTVSRTGSQIATVDASTLFAPWGHEMSVVPLGRVEFAVAGILGPDLKVRGSAGLDFPGFSKFNITLIYLFGAR